MIPFIKPYRGGNAKLYFRCIKKSSLSGDGFYTKKGVYG